MWVCVSGCVGTQEKTDSIKIKSPSEKQSAKAGDVVSHGRAPRSQDSVLSQIIRTNENRKQDVGNHVPTPALAHPANPNALSVVMGNRCLFSRSHSSDNSSIFSPSYQRPSAPTAALPSKRSKGTEVATAEESCQILPAKRKKPDSNDHSLNAFRFTVPDTPPDTSPVSAPKHATSPVDSLPSSMSLPAQPRGGDQTTTSSEASVPVQPQSGSEPSKKRKIIIIKRPVSSRATVSSTINRPTSPRSGPNSVSSCMDSSSAISNSVRVVCTDGPISTNSPSLGGVSMDTAISHHPTRVHVVTTTNAHAQPVRKHSNSHATLSDVSAPDHAHEPSENKCLEAEALGDGVAMSDTSGVEEKPTNKRKSLPRNPSVNKEAAEDCVLGTKQIQGPPRKPSLAEVRAEM